MEAISTWMTSLGLAYYVNKYEWMWPLCEVLHFVGMSLLIGTIGAMDLRILGLGKSIPIAALERFVPLGIAAFAINAITGFVFVAGNVSGPPLDYLSNLSFQVKMTCIVLAGINVLAYYLTGVARGAAATAPAGDAPPVDKAIAADWWFSASRSRAGGDAPRSAKVVAVISILLWLGVICFGRLIMYNDTLLLALGIGGPIPE
jgi:hypothetical protein